MLLQLLLLIGGFVLLIKGADIMIDGAASTAQNFKISKMIIGLTIIAFGTSAPEFAISISSLISGSTDMVIGNVIGSNITNILLLVGVAALIHPISVRKDTIRKELPICLMISTALVILLLDVNLAGAEHNLITRADALTILLFFAVFIFYILSSAIQARKKDKDDVVEKPKFNLPISLILVVLGTAGIVAGSQCVVSGATSIATSLGIPERIVALTIVAVGTSLPELVTTITASRKGEQDLLLGNILGSNIFNICVVLGIPVALFGTITSESFQALDLIMLIASSLILLVICFTHRRVSRMEGWILLVMYFAYYACIVTQGLTA